MNGGVRLGLIGVGHWGRNLARACAETGVLAAVCDRDPAVLAWVRATYPHVAIEPELQDLLAGDVDGVVIATPAELHAELALAALEAGKHVFVEKPLALSVSDGLAIARRAERANRLVFVGHLLLYHPGVRALLRAVENGSIGRVWHVRTRRLSMGRLRRHEDVLWSFAPHDISVALAVMGAPPHDVDAAYSGFIAPDIADRAYLTMHFAGGRSGHVEVSWFDPDKVSRIDVFGTEGVLTFEDARAGPSLRRTRAGVDRDQDGAPVLWSETAVELQMALGEPLKLEIEAFIDAIRDGVPPPSDAHQGVAVLRVLAMAAESGRRDYMAQRMREVTT
jgi:UDP-2-acetamido-3-amino-2,3-dideoxy-glucuronate N-acetyltransferase